MNRTCPSRDEIEQALAGELADAQAEDLFGHFEDCANCGQLVQRIEAEQRSRDDDWLSSALRDPSSVSQSCGSSERFLARCLQVAAARIDDLDAIGAIRDYRLLYPIGMGAMGRVYRATHGHLKRDVAVKVLSPTRFDSPLAAERFRIEMEAVGQLDHPNIVRASDAGEHEGILYLVMDWAAGVDLGRVLARFPKLSQADAAAVTVQAARGLAYAHAKRIVHRDIKPSNLLLTCAGDVRILDFGLALLPLSGSPREPSFAGSISYMAPEQCAAAQRVDPAADIFALGCTLFQMLAGERLFQLDHSASVERQLCERATMTTDLIARRVHEAIGQPLESIVTQMLAHRPADRPSAEVVVRLLEDVATDARLKTLVAHLPAAHDPSDAAWNSIEQSAPPRRRWFRIAAIVATVALLGGLSARLFEPVSRPSVVVAPRQDAAAEGHAAAKPIDARALQFVRVEVWGELPTRDTVHVLIEPGLAAEVSIVRDDVVISTHQAWDLLNLKLKHAPAFEAYNRLLPALRSCSDPAALLATQDPIPQPATRATVIYADRHGKQLEFLWTQSGFAAVFSE